MTLGPLMVDVAGKTLTPEDRDVLRHPLVELARPFRVHLDELREDIDGPEELLLKDQHPL